MPKSNLTIGADPEFFLYSQTHDRIVPSCGLLGGTKEEPMALGRRGYFVQEDNVMAEYNIPPCPTGDKFGSCITKGRDLVLAHARERSGDDSLVAFRGTYAELSPDMLQHPGAMRFGCSPDFDAYQMGQPCPPIDPDRLTGNNGVLRFAGGHVHLGYNLPEIPPQVVAMFCDLMLGAYAIAYGLDRQGPRRQWYGTPGRYRPTPYGIEYRTLGNHWTLDTHSAIVIGRRALMTLRFLQNANKETIREMYMETPWTALREAIQSESESDCLKILEGATERMLAEQAA